MQCRFCGGRLELKTRDRTPWEKMVQERPDPEAIPEYAKKMIAFLTREKMTVAEFIRRYNLNRWPRHSRGAKHGTAPKLDYRKWKRWMSGTNLCPREAAMRITRMCRQIRYDLPVWECPFFHPHAAMRHYRKEYHAYWKANREWFKTHPGQDPGEWWNTMKPEDTE